MDNKNNHQEESENFLSLPLLLGLLLACNKPEEPTSKLFIQKLAKIEARISMLEDNFNQIKKIL